MNKHLFIALSTGILAVTAVPVWATVTEARELPNGAQFTVDGGIIRVQFWSPEIARITSGTGAELPALKSLSVIASPETVNLTRQQDDKSFILTSLDMKVKVDKQTGAVTFLDHAGHVLLQETDHGRKIEPNTVAGTAVTSCAQTFKLAPNEGIYGLGQHQHDVWNYLTDGSVRLAQANTDVGIPVMTSSKGYLLLWDNPAVTTISSSPVEGSHDCQKLLHWSSEYGKSIDYYFCYGDGTIATAMKAYRHLTGNAPLMPEWELGFWQCKERYASQKELLSVAKKLRELRVPVDGIIQDWQYWPTGTNTWGSHLFDPERYPDAEGMFKELHAMHYHALISVWAKFDLGSKNSKELNAVGGMFPEVTSYAFPPGHGQWYDPFAAIGRQTYWKQIRDELFSKGVDGWWLDAPEPEIGGMAFRTYKTPMGPGYEVYNAFPLMHSTGIYQGQRATTEKKRVVILTRSAYAGQHRNSAITWSGDIQGTWSVFRAQIPAGLNFSLSGIPYWNTDTGGFFGNRSTGNGDPKNPEYAELFTRWFQFSAFCPMFRVHGTVAPKEFWRWDKPTQQIWERFVDLRYRLLPYIYSVSWQVTHNGSTMMRPLIMDFPSDPRALNIGNQYLFGPAIMVAPVTQPASSDAR